MSVWRQCSVNTTTGRITLGSGSDAVRVLAPQFILNDGSDYAVVGFGTVVAIGAGSGLGFDPATLFASGEDGAWYDLSDISTLWQDAAGTVAVTAAGDPVRRMDDKSGNANHAIAPSDAARPTYQVDGSGNAYLAPDGVDDWMPATGANLGETWTHVGGWVSTGVGRFAFATSTDFRGALRHSGLGAQAWSWYNSAGSLTDITTGLATVDAVVTVEQASTTSLTGRYNGVTEITITPYNDSALTQGLALFTQQNNAFSSGMPGKFYGGIWINRALTATERASAESFVSGNVPGVTL